MPETKARGAARHMRLVGAPLLAVMLMTAAMPAAAQGLFSPAITVDDRAITRFEIDQRAKLLSFFNTPGDLQTVARNQLVDDALRQAEMTRYNLSLTDEQYQAALNEFAGRANLTSTQLATTLREQGIDPAALRDYLRVNVLWRDYIRARFNTRVTITDADIDDYIARTTTASQGMQVLLSEAILPLIPGQEDQIRQIATQISQISSVQAFSDAARQYSVVPSREQGGQMDWVPLSNFPAGLQNLLRSLREGEVTSPLYVEGAVALLQLRGLREGPVSAPRIASIEYATLRVASTDEAARLQGRIAVCDDMYTYAQGESAASVVRQTLPPANVPTDIGVLLSSLNPGNSLITPAADGSATIVMLCARTPEAPATLTRDVASNMLRGERLESYGDGLIAQLRANAVIRGL
ncbi:peptidyl-prolyl cis-trans isomerase SurA [Ketogulonicigenium robustum]|uniref:Parvulin-like PPIase n=2 Tax=Ketogulonicigenium robustum TaxID=92947 RepID=A0A1W6P006_9RHOB|nr:peptidyl-prolyl cis-trans isomerase SurA [Ketogulonicigenium robustum]